MGPQTDSSIGLETDTRAVSEVVAFILVFAIILGSVGILYSTGFGAMSDYQEHEQTVNAERAMDALTGNFNDVIRYNGVNERYGELSLRDGTVSIGSDGTELEIEIDDTSIGADGEPFEDYSNENDDIDLGEFAYTHEDTKIAYEGGGLVRSEESADWSTALRQPHLKCNKDQDTAVISLVQITSDSRSIQSSDGLGFTMSVENRTSHVYDENDLGSDGVVINENGAYEDAWDSILDSNGWESGECDGDEIDRAVVTIVEVDIEY